MKYHWCYYFIFYEAFRSIRTTTTTTTYTTVDATDTLVVTTTTPTTLPLVENDVHHRSSETTTTTTNNKNNNIQNACVTIDEHGNTISNPEEHCLVESPTTTNDDDDDSTSTSSSTSSVPNTHAHDIHDNPTDEFRFGSDLGVVQLIDSTMTDAMIQAIEASRHYMTRLWMDTPTSTITTTTTTNDDDNETPPPLSTCRNTHELCTFWSLHEECTNNAAYMHLYCAPACQTCHVVFDAPPGTFHVDPITTNHAANDEEEEDEDEEEEEVDDATRALNLKRGSDLGIMQSIDDDVYGDQILDAIVKTRSYLHDIVYVDDKYTKVRDLCLNTHESCTYWALIGECEANPGFMLLHCAPACQTCDKVHVDTRCPMNDTATTVFPEPDTLNQFYERILQDPYYQSQYNVTVLSRPTYADGDRPDDTTLTYAVTGLWVIQFDNIVNETEAQRLIEMGKEEGYERSADVGEAKPDGTFDSSVNDGRTSTNAWCMKDCMNDPATVQVHDRIENITSISRQNYENLQILQYHEHQYYNEHNDFIEYQVDRPCGSRVLTFYIYLNTLPEDGGGGTNFPKLNLTVTPKLGRAILWPSILNDRPFEMDPLSNHQALPVLNGYIKYGVNAWIHQRDFQEANHVGCA